MDVMLFAVSEASHEKPASDYLSVIRFSLALATNRC
jgi:hypothetical protein